MKITVTSTGPTLDDAVEPRFGRCPYFLIIDTENNAFQALPNPNISQSSGAGTSSAQMMADHGVTAVLTGNCGPKASQVFQAAGIQIITGVGGTVQEAVTRFKSRSIRVSPGSMESSSVGAPGMGSGRGMGCRKGMGGGRGMGGGGRGMGGGFGQAQSMGGAPSDGTLTSSDDDIQGLKETAENLRRQLETIEKQIANLSIKR